MQRERWYNYLIGGVLILLLSLLLSKAIWPIITTLINSYKSIGYYIAVNLTFIPLVISISGVSILYNRIQIKKVNITRFTTGFLIWFLIQLIVLGHTLIFDNESIDYNFSYNQFFIFFGLSLFFTPIQVAAEEFIFRGYLHSLLKSFKANRAITIILSATLFALPHLANPEVNDQKIVFFLLYLSMGLLLSYLTVRYNGLEYAFGIHFANNFFAVNFLNYPNSPLPSSPLFYANQEIAPLPSLVQSVVVSLLVIFIIKQIEIYNTQRENN